MIRPDRCKQEAHFPKAWILLMISLVFFIVSEYNKNVIYNHKISHKSVIKNTKTIIKV